MNLKDFKTLGFTGTGVSHHPEGETYFFNVYKKDSALKAENIVFKIQTSDAYFGYLWVCNSKGYNCELVSREATVDKVKSLISLDSKDNVVFLDD
jgi:hypothetical protein